jgi:hypothetical protein
MNEREKDAIRRQHIELVLTFLFSDICTVEYSKLSAENKSSFLAKSFAAYVANYGLKDSIFFLDIKLSVYLFCNELFRQEDEEIIH